MFACGGCHQASLSFLIKGNQISINASKTSKYDRQCLPHHHRMTIVKIFRLLDVQYVKRSVFFKAVLMIPIFKWVPGGKKWFSGVRSSNICLKLLIFDSFGFLNHLRLEKYPLLSSNGFLEEKNGFQGSEAQIFV